MDRNLEETTEAEKEHLLASSVEETIKKSNICDINQQTDYPETTTSKPKLPFAYFVQQQKHERNEDDLEGAQALTELYNMVNTKENDEETPTHKDMAEV